MKGFFGVIIVLIISIFVITLFITQNEINNQNYENSHFNEATKLNNYELTLTQKAWDTNWEKINTELEQDFNNSSNEIINHTFGTTQCETKNWNVNNTEKIITFDLNCTLTINNYQEEKQLNYAKKIILNGKI